MHVMYTNATEVNATTTTLTYDVYPNGFRIQEEKLLLGVGLGAGLLFALSFVALVGAVACRGQYVRKAGRRGRRLTSTVSLAYSDFDTFKSARKYHTPPSTDISIITSSSASIYATPIKLKSPPTKSLTTPKTTLPSTTTTMMMTSPLSYNTSNNHSNSLGGGSSSGSGEKRGKREKRREGGRRDDSNERRRSEEATLKLDEWRYIEPMITTTDIKSQSDSSSGDQAPPMRADPANEKTISRQGDKKQFSTKMLSNVFSGKRHG